jgi:hypothetical protein
LNYKNTDEFLGGNMLITHRHKARETKEKVAEMRPSAGYIRLEENKCWHVVETQGQQLYKWVSTNSKR